MLPFLILLAAGLIFALNYEQWKERRRRERINRFYEEQMRILNIQFDSETFNNERQGQ